MKKIAINVVEAAERQASSLSRVWQHTQNRNIGIISACRAENAEKDPALNHRLTRELAADIRNSGYGYIMVKGSFIENMGSPQEKRVQEDSFLVIGRAGDDSGNLKGFLTKAGAKYGQDSVLLKPFNEETAFLIGTRDGEGAFPGLGKTYNVGKWVPNRLSEIYSEMYPGATFTFAAAEGKRVGRPVAAIEFFREPTLLSRPYSGPVPF